MGIGKGNVQPADVAKKWWLHCRNDGAGGGDGGVEAGAFGFLGGGSENGVGGGGVVCGGGLEGGCIEDNGETSRGEAGRECGGESMVDWRRDGNVGGFRVFVMRALVEKMGERRRECRKKWRMKGGRGVQESGSGGGGNGLC
ncbi:uncharacterized protein LOC131170612 [Hevea brasiliensis]|uniref:uncharacterized protein LOC131170612 n=1 Tax=Hevea brasiliensis TaxID=3981 RepID=UPI0025EA525E|nr:uncharacterized protein LOC131170612 [Hevea brasiliensis]